MREIAQFGCICCWLTLRVKSVPEIHHMLSGGQRLGHRFTIPLCHDHHQGGKNNAIVVSRDRNQRRFEARYGTEESLRLKVAQFIKWRDMAWLTAPQ